MATKKQTRTDYLKERKKKIDAAWLEPWYTYDAPAPLMTLAPMFSPWTISIGTNPTLAELDEAIGKLEVMRDAVKKRSSEVLKRSTEALIARLKAAWGDGTAVPQAAQVEPWQAWQRDPGLTPRNRDGRFVNRAKARGTP